MICKYLQDSKKSATLIVYVLFPQINDFLEPDCQDRKEETVDITHLGINYVKQYSEKLLGYEALLDGNLDLDMPKPVGK